MPNFTTLTRANATSTGQWSDGHQLLTWQVWTPNNPNGGGNVSGYVAPDWPVYFFRIGGADMNPAQLDLNTNSTALMFINELGCAVVAYDVTPCGFYVEGVVDPEAVFFPESMAEDAAAIGFFRDHSDDEDIWSAGGSITRSPDRSAHSGNSSGGHRVLFVQMQPEGTFDFGDDALTGNARFRGDRSHCCNFVIANQPQTVLSTFVKSKWASGTTAPTTFTVNGPHAAGVSAVSITGDTCWLLKGNRVQFSKTSAYLTNGAQTTGSNSLVIDTGSEAIPLEAIACVNVGGTDYTARVRANYTGGAGSLLVTASSWSESGIAIPDNTPVILRFEHSVEADQHGAGTLTLSQPLTLDFPGGSNVILAETALEKYGDYAWCGGYFFHPCDGYVWNTDGTLVDAVEFDWDIKRQADIDPYVSADNPRIRDAHWLLIGASSNTLIRSNRTGTWNFLDHMPAPWGNRARGEISGAHNDLHGEANEFFLGYVIDACGGDVEVYAGNTTSNPSTEVGATAWNKGTNAALSTAVIKAWAQSRGFA